MNEQAMRKFIIRNKLGFHARAASQFVRIASSFNSDIFVQKNSQEVNGKSIMGILILAAAKGTEITVKAEGSTPGRLLTPWASL